MANRVDYPYPTPNFPPDHYTDQCLCEACGSYRLKRDRGMIKMPSAPSAVSGMTQSDYGGERIQYYGYDYQTGRDTETSLYPIPPPGSDYKPIPTPTQPADNDAYRRAVAMQQKEAVERRVLALQAQLQSLEVLRDVTKDRLSSPDPDPSPSKIALEPGPRKIKSLD